MEKIENNYIQFGNMHIIFNLDNNIHSRIASLVFPNNSQGNKSVLNQNFHIFLTSMNNMQEYLKSTVNLLNGALKVTIHIPKNVEDLKVLTELYLSESDTPCKIIIERKGPEFVMSGNDRLTLKLEYLDDGISVCVPVTKIGYTDYNLQGNPGAIRTAPMRLLPDIFKDKIIANFKESCPANILLSFDTDTSIWEYIMEQGEWSTTNDTPRNNYTDKMTNAQRPKFNSPLGKDKGE